MPLIRSQTRQLVRVLAAALCVAVAGIGAAAAQTSGACQRYRAELANVSDGASVARALQSEIARLEAYFRTLNCEGGKFLFFDTRPPQCGAVEQRIRALNAGYGPENGEVAAARRRQLQAAVASACADQPRGADAASDLYARGGSQVICVRTCDGAYFPMNNLPDGREGANELCQALCPGAEAAAYSMPRGDDALKHAATVKGSRAYASLANAFKFQKAFVPNCSCKREGQSWAQSLVKAESMLVRHKGDIFVTPMQAEALSRPKVRLTLVGRADKTAAGLAADAAGRAGEAAPLVPDAAVATAKDERAPIRVIAPNVIAVPKLLAVPGPVTATP
ncbi:DUF2865 domain-containing protein [Methylobacterium planeticum]|uniref:DUF2865 domain-containing protein n=1 Tax=Methylobacterium planeticum TaxID=2615211 RepID=A0A6N6MRT5_9HYPH|nr:DUF2865 domain-containing protein [Methylobacterium planeticum]KAB1073920.1 DUF2865 domain-containing protein [Methylobacterium planeticum]